VLSLRISHVGADQHLHAGAIIGADRVHVGAMFDQPLEGHGLQRFTRRQMIGYFPAQSAFHVGAMVRTGNSIMRIRSVGQRGASAARRPPGGRPEPFSSIQRTSA